MDPVIEIAPTGRAKCRGCGQAIQKNGLRIGDVFANPFADDAVTTHWYHPRCAAYKRPEVAKAAFAAIAAPFEQRDALVREADRGLVHQRLPRIDGADRAPTARAACRACKAKIERGAWRVKLVWFEDWRFAPSGFVHAACAPDYFETGALLDRITWFSPGLGADELADLARRLGEGTLPA